MKQCGRKGHPCFTAPQHATRINTGHSLFPATAFCVEKKSFPKEKFYHIPYLGKMKGGRQNFV